MLDVISSFFRPRVTAQTEQADREHALRLATAALLVEVVRADFGVDQAELEATLRVLEKQFELDAQESKALLKLAREESEQAVSLHAFTRLINENYDAQSKERVIELMWQIAYADGVKDKHEEHLIRKVADLLYVPHVRFVKARHAAAEAARRR
jgi:uncharacterized tellurite resistance protein B-like protein